MAEFGPKVLLTSMAGLGQPHSPVLPGLLAVPATDRRPSPPGVYISSAGATVPGFSNPESNDLPFELWVTQSTVITGWTTTSP